MASINNPQVIYDHYESLCVPLQYHCHHYWLDFTPTTSLSTTQLIISSAVCAVDNSVRIEPLEGAKTSAVELSQSGLVEGGKAYKNPLDLWCV